MCIKVNRSILVGIISDTHNFLTSSIEYVFRNCSTIIHAGDIGNVKVLNKLRSITRLVAIRGNTDNDPSLGDLPETRAINLYGIPFYVIHDLSMLRIDPVADGVKIVVSGHTHKPMVFEQDGVKYINPGSAGYCRVGYPITLGLISLENKTINTQIIELDS